MGGRFVHQGKKSLDTGGKKRYEKGGLPDDKWQKAWPTLKVREEEGSGGRV